MKKAKVISRPKFENTRKTLRKQKRQQKKVHRHEHYLKKKDENVRPKYTPGRFVKRPTEDPKTDEELKMKKPKLQPTMQEVLKKQREKELKEANHLKSEMDKQRKKMLLQANEEEDMIIKKLEKQLGLNKAKHKNKFFSDDGLDYLLEVCDRSTTEQIVAAEKQLAEVENESDFEEDLAVVTGKQKKSKADKKTKTPITEMDKNELDEDSDGSEFYDEISDEDLGDDMGNKDTDDDMSNQDVIDEMSNQDINDEIDSANNDESEESDDSLPTEKPSKRTKLKNDNVKIQDSEKNNKKSQQERIVKADDLNKVFSDDEVSHLSGDDDLDGFSDEDDIKNKLGDGDNKDEKPDVWEDIYGRKRDKEGNIIKEEKGIYIPPHLRNKDSTSEKEMMHLKRQIKSVLNKVSGSNLHWSCSTLESLYSSNSRHGVNSSLTQLWIEATVATSSTPDRLVAEHAALVSILHANVGSEIGAHFLEELSRRFDEMMQTAQPVEDKRLDNLVSCLAYLYSFKIYQANLLYDILYRLLEHITEKNIDCILVALRSVGGVLRKDDPSALNKLIHDIHPRVAALNQDAAAGSRIKFLLEVLMALKNNNLTKIPNYDPSYAEHLKKQTKGIIRKGNYVTTLNIRLEDLLKAHERGKWWVVGSAWEGNRPIQEGAVKTQPAFDQKLLELARQHRMNTDVRRSIFCVIMSAEDYMDAFEKLQQLGLKGQQSREIVAVLLACCLAERTHNPYYAVLAHKLCITDRKYLLSIQFSVWDKIKDLESLIKQNLNNLAQFLIHLILAKGLPLSVLKIIQFSELNKQTVRFMRQILLAIIMNEDLQATLEVFHRISKSPKLHMFRESLRLFIHHFLVKNAGKKSDVLTEQEMEVLKERAVEVDKILTMYESKLMF